MGRTLILTDSTCDLPSNWIERLNIRVVPTYVQFGIESLADDGIQLTRHAFYTRLVSDPLHPTTSTPSLGQTIDIMASALNDADHVVAITAPARFSGLHNVFRLAAEKLAPERVTLIDSETLSMGLGWQVAIAAEMAQEGASPIAIQREILRIQPHLDVWAALDTMEYLRRSGRVGWAAAFMGGLLNIKPIIRMYLSEVTSTARVRTSERAFNRLRQLVQDAAPLERLAIMHTNYPDGAIRLLDSLANVHPEYEVPIVDVTPVLGVHVGPKGLGAAILRRVQT